MDISMKKLERRVEKAIKQAYSSNEILRCYHLLELMFRINPKNKVLHIYVNKIDDKKLKKAKLEWAYKSDQNYSFFRKPFIYLSFLYLLITGQL